MSSASSKKGSYTYLSIISYLYKQETRTRSNQVNLTSMKPFLIDLLDNTPCSPLWLRLHNRAQIHSLFPEIVISVTVANSTGTTWWSYISYWWCFNSVSSIPYKILLAKVWERQKEGHNLIFYYFLRSLIPSPWNHSCSKIVPNLTHQQNQSHNQINKIRTKNKIKSYSSFVSQGSSILI